jgi:uncharacterized protein (DUF983 family)
MGEMVAKLHGALVIMSTKRCTVGTSGRCPACGSTRFYAAPGGWIECDECHAFACDKSQYDKLMQEEPPNDAA